ncbi:MAG: glycosyltransferase family 2 protein, partial [Syntrophobacterales bacterium]|nr:glycosyltransferase family 2 protein [Syntrophobacterales bacterium]
QFLFSNFDVQRTLTKFFCHFYKNFTIDTFVKSPKIPSPLMPACACPHADRGEGRGEGEYSAISSSYVPLPFIPSHEGRGSLTFYESITIKGLTMGEKIPLSVAIITKNEAENMPGCIGSVKFADQIVVVDSGSTDDTVKIATDFGCDVFIEKWRGFGPQKQFAIDKCKHRWVLVLDADERIPPETAMAIEDLVSKGSGDVAGYSFPRKNWFRGRWIKHLWGGDRIVRLFQKDLGRMTSVAVHESVEVSGHVEALDVPIEHFTESDLSKILIKIDHYSTLGAQEAFIEGRKATIWSASFRAALAFFQSYFLKLGALDGAQGLTLSITNSVNKFFKYAKLSELHKQAESSAQGR